MLSSMVRSAPAQNDSLPEVMTTPLIAASAATCSTIAASSSFTAASMTFIDRPGESQVTSAMPSPSMSRVKWMKLMCTARRFTRVTHAGVVAHGDQIDVRIGRRLALRARADFQIDRVALRAVDEMMTVRRVGLEAGGVAGLEHGLAFVLDQHELAFEDVDELILLLVPVPQRRGRAGLERREIDAELVEADGVAEALASRARRRRGRVAADSRCGYRWGVWRCRSWAWLRSLATPAR